MKLKSIFAGLAIPLPGNKREEFLTVETNKGVKIKGLTLDLVTMDGLPVVVVNAPTFPDPVCVPFANIRTFVPFPPEEEKAPEKAPETTPDQKPAKTKKPKE